MMKNMLSSTDKKIEEFRTTLEQLTMDFQSAVAVETAIRIVQIKMISENVETTVNELGKHIYLSCVC